MTNNNYNYDAELNNFIEMFAEELAEKIDNGYFTLDVYMNEYEEVEFDFYNVGPCVKGDWEKVEEIEVDYISNNFKVAQMLEKYCK